MNKISTNNRNITIATNNCNNHNYANTNTKYPNTIIHNDSNRNNRPNHLITNNTNNTTHANQYNVYSTVSNCDSKQCQLFWLSPRQSELPRK